jgi:transcriptional regulator with AAA-type ATPase domain/tetratricopeptide (TPR) repeat protein
LLGQSAAIVALRGQITRLLQRPRGAHRLPPILIQGETGTGKGLLARAMHQAGPRAAGPFVAVNCAAIPETLIEAELFGVERGAFTDARQARAGLFQAAHKGTLFLDELETLAIGLQAKLLTAIEERVIRRLGSARSETVDVCIIAATNEDLRLAVAERRFREDLYHRLSVLVVDLPPLRERGPDILLLAEHFLARACEDYGLPPKTLGADARAAMRAYAWPGNVRELANIMERTALLTDARGVTAKSLALTLPPEGRAPILPVTPASGPESAHAGGETDEREQLQALMRRVGWNLSRAAAELGTPRNTLRYRLEKLGLQRDDATAVIGRAPGPVEEASRPPSPGPGAAPELPIPPSLLRWERRPTTLLRIQLSAPAETAAFRLETMLDACVERIRSFGGRVEELNSGGMEAIFGLEPMEDAPSRAALAALAIRRAATRAPEAADYPVAVTIVIHVRTCLIGRGGGVAAIDPEDRQEGNRTLAALLEAAAPGAILVSPDLARLLGRRFDLEAFTGTETAYCLAGREPAGVGRAAWSPSCFFGREREIALLRELVAGVNTGTAHVVGIMGEAGAGKSRLLEEFRVDVEPKHATYLEGRCVSYGSAIPYLPVLDIVRGLCGIVDTDSPEALAGKIREGLRTAGMAPGEWAPYLLHLLGVKDQAEDVAALSPEVVQGRALEALRRMILQASGDRPVVVGIEDLHWIDRTSEEFLTSLIAGLARGRVLFVATWRPGYRAPWMERSYATQIALRPLTHEDSLAVVRSIAVDEGIPEAIAAMILEKAEGNPFFLEELTRTVTEQGGLGAEAALPATVQGVLTARIDRLSPEDQHLLQAASVIGKDVPVSLLRAVTDLPEQELRQGLGRLQNAEFLCETHLFPELEYTFKHGLTQEVAYASLPPERRRRFHARIVETLEATHADRLSEQVERLADHALRGEAWPKALLYLRLAGTKAVGRSANLEAVACYERALDVLRHLPESRGMLEQGVDLRFDLRNALFPLGEYGRIVEHLREAQTLLESLDDQRRLGRLSAYMANYLWRRGDPDRALDSGRRALAIAATLGDFALQVESTVRLGLVYHALGDFRRAMDSLRRAVASLDGSAVRERFGMAGLPAVVSHAYLVWSQAELGEFAAGIADAEAGARIAEEVGQAQDIVPMYRGVGLLHLRRGEFTTAISVLERGLVLCRDLNLPVWFPVTASCLGAAYALAGRVDEAVPLLQRALEQGSARKLMTGHPLLITHLGEAYLLAGRTADALELAGQALALSREQKERANEAWALRLLGEIASQPPDVAKAEAFFSQAMALADELGMRPLRAHCLLGLGSLFAVFGERERSQAALSGAIQGFRSMQMTLWFDRAEALMARSE